MTRTKKTKTPDLPDLSPSQLEIMQEVWKQDETTVSEVRERLLEKRSVARNTVLTLMDRLNQKGWLKRRLKAGIHYYSATASQKATLGDMLNQMVENAFSGSSADLVLTLLESRELSKDEALHIQSLIKDAGKKERKP